MARKYPEKYGPLLLLDAGLITVFTAFLVIFMWVIIDSIDLFNPFDDYIDNFDYSDLVYSEMSRKDDIYTTDTNIYIVNIGDLSRGELAQKINIIEKFEPRVIGIDAVFKEPKNGNIQEIMEDMALKQALNAKPNIVMGSFGIYDEENPDKAVGVIRTNEFFGDLPYGHCELQNEPLTCREFDKFIRFTDSITHDTVTINAFSAAIVSMYDNEMFMRFAKRNKKQLESVNYRGGSMPFIKIDYEDVNDSCNLSMLRDKIVLMGYLGMYKGAPMDTIDAFFTPLKRCNGYDAKGIEIHAHAISMIMNDDCLVTLEPWQNNAIAFVITFLFVLWLVYWYVFGAKFFDILSKPIQFLLIGVALLISYYVMREFGIKVDMMPSGIMLIFCIEVLYLYEETLELFKIDSFITQTFKYTKDERNKVLRSIVRFEFIRNKFKR
ncbi:MAG: CHASE2 domain-containing protein, partial [Bacteroidales bacterium]|nr:CHASE2 domain-containing protein [Bacteroidales bacterium]